MARKSKKEDAGCLTTIIAWIIVIGIIVGLLSVAWQAVLAVVAIIFIIAFIVALVNPKHEFKPSSDSNNNVGLEYEHFCAEWLLYEKGYRKVTVTPPTGDFGADLVAIDKKGIKWVFQCKHYQSKLGNTPIQEVVTAISHYRADRAGVITNSTFTPKAKQLAKENNVVLFEKVTSYGTRSKKKMQKGKSNKPYSIEEMMFYDDISEP